MDALDFLDDVDDYYGYDDNGPTSAEEPEGTLKFSETALKDAVDPIAPSSGEYGIDLYEQTVECISNRCDINVFMRKDHDYVCL